MRPHNGLRLAKGIAAGQPSRESACGGDGRGTPEA